MKVNQVYEILNTISEEMLGDSVVVQEDLSNIVDVGRAFENLENGLDNYVRRLQDHILLGVHGLLSNGLGQKQEDLI